ncbi:GGDEF domain-containing response regulator [Methylobacterium nonmethylotrophicum]|uniref:diguanylate cyclase n=1 Tax=Methylobacterium nonmethylotrophicum TaxID=1141884 RepID=A0A4Z0NRL3_9HYPH|nr:diguanylate cyclase [Methylobacterium nonmethylotrophicum]TGD99791.1 diguanylate cyclase [Methylobacterium nonmethylotrophicum]
MRVVLVEPGLILRKTVARLIEEGGHQVDSFSDSEQALAHVAAHEDVACVITSLEVGPICGLELCWSLRTLAGTVRPLAVIAMSTDRAGRGLGEVLDSGADDFISKPPEAVELHARLRVVERGLGLQRQLIREADTDSLTQLLSRGGFMRRAGAAVAALAPQDLLTALMIDIDSFKAINDRHGHDSGDRVIRSVADVLKETGALAGRIGGEEFAVLMPGHGLGSAGVVADRIRAGCARLRVPGRRGPIPVTCSLGLSAFAEGDTVETLLARADHALYAAKAGGRNQVMSAAGRQLDRVS